MTLEELEQLKPGDKVVFCSENLVIPGATWTKRVIEVQERNGGYLTVEKLCIDLNAIRCNKGLGLFYYEWLELYEKPNRLWSYERDY
jgi:hypothetical protein